MADAGQCESLARTLADEIGLIPEVDAVALGGSQSTGASDAGSDIDLYVYSVIPVRVALRERLAASRSTGRKEIDNHIFETGDEWDDDRTGIHVDITYRDLAGTRSNLLRVMDDHQASVGYTTCIWHNVRNSIPLFDRTGGFGTLQDLSKRAYPDALVRAIVSKNQPLVRGNFGSFGSQILKAAGRNDVVSVNHRRAAFLASYFDVLFAANRALHPGEKRLLTFAAALDVVPPGFPAQVEGFLAARSGADLERTINTLADGIEAILREQELLP